MYVTANCQKRALSCSKSNGLDIQLLRIPGRELPILTPKERFLLILVYHWAAYEKMASCSCNIKVKAPKLFAVARCLFYWTLHWSMKYSKFYFKNVRILLDTLNIKFRGASMLKDIRRVASHITGMTIRSMRSVLKFFHWLTSGVTKSVLPR